VFYNVTINEGAGTFKPPIVYVSADTAVCAGELVTLWAGGAPVQAWLHGTDTLCRYCDTLVVHADSNATYQAKILAMGCEDSAMVIVAVHDVPLPDTSRTVSTCPDTPVTITARPGFARYLWSTGDTTQAIQLSAEGWYAVTVATEFGCATTDSIRVVFEPATRMDVVGHTPGLPVLMPEVLPAALSRLDLYIRNISDSTLIISRADLDNNTGISVPLHQFPVTIAPSDTGQIQIVGGSNMPGEYQDEVYLYEACGFIKLRIGLVVQETPAHSRCVVRVTGSGELEGLTGLELQGAKVSDLLGREVVPPLVPGVYLVTEDGATYLVQMP
jgi:hypothetical protein